MTMIELNDPRAPSNLTNSHVLKMVEEEEYEKTYPVKTERQSRPRKRCITREDVLKINRRHQRRDISWPPLDENRSRSRSSSEEIHFDERVRKRHEIFHLKEMFDRGPIEDANKRNNSRHVTFAPSSSISMTTDKEITGSTSPSENRKTVQFDGGDESAKRHEREWFSGRSHSNGYDGNPTLLAKKTFHLPENELHIGKIEPIRRYFLEEAWKTDGDGGGSVAAACSTTWPRRSSSSSPSRRPLVQGRSGIVANNLPPKRWRSHENITLAHNAAASQLAASHKKDNLPLLERHKSSSYNELPPLKPRREDHKNVHFTKKKLNLNNSVRGELRKSDESLKIDATQSGGRSRSADTIRPGEGVTAVVMAPSSTVVGENAIRSPQVTGSVDDTKNTNEWGHESGKLRPPDTSHDNCSRETSEYEAENSCTDGNLRRPVTNSDSLNNNQRFARHDNDGIRNEAIKQNDDLRHSRIPFGAPELNKLSPSQHRNAGIRDEHETKSEEEISRNLSNRRDKNSQREGPPSVPIRLTSLNWRQSRTTNEDKHHEQKEPSANSSCMSYGDFRRFEDGDSQQKSGMYFTDGEYIWGPYDITTVFPEEMPAKESLWLKRNLVEEAITEDIRRIREYMRRVEETLHGPACNSTTLADITPSPLQTILRQIMVQQGLTRFADRTEMCDSVGPCFNPMIIGAENMPVVDQVLLELFNISKTLETLNGTNNSSDNNGSSNSGARITELDETQEGTTSADTVSSVTACNTSPTRENPAPRPGSSTSTGSGSSGTISASVVDRIVQSKNILGGYLIAKQSQEELFRNIHSSETDASTTSTEAASPIGAAEFANGKTFSEVPFSMPATEAAFAITGVDVVDEGDDHADEIRDVNDENNNVDKANDYEEVNSEHKEEDTAVAVDDDRTTLHINNINNYNEPLVSDKMLSAGDNLLVRMSSEKIMSLNRLTDGVATISRKVDKLIEGPIKLDQQEACSAGLTIAAVVHPPEISTMGLLVDSPLCKSDSTLENNDKLVSSPKFNIREKVVTVEAVGDNFVTNYQYKLPESHNPSHKDDDGKLQERNYELVDVDDEKNHDCRYRTNLNVIRPVSALSNYPASEWTYSNMNANDSESCRQPDDYHGHRSRCRTKSSNFYDSPTAVRSSSQPCSQNRDRHSPAPFTSECPFDSYGRLCYYSTPRLYTSDGGDRFTPTEGYKRVAWPPVESQPVYQTVPVNFEPLANSNSYEQNQGYQQPQAKQNYQTVSHQPSGQTYQTQNYQQPNSYQQPQQYQQPPQQQQYYTQAPYTRGQSPGVIQLRKEVPISQRPAPVYASQPAAASFRGGSKMRGDLKWPPPEYKEQVARENEERRRIALGPVCRPRRVNKDYSPFFAKNALNHYYPGYKVPPGTQHMYTQY